MNAKNWFDPRFGKRPARFVGRDDVLRDIRASIGDADKSERITILTGIKGAGKTSILAEIRAELDPSRFVVVDFARDAGSRSIPVAQDTQNEDAVRIYFADAAGKGAPGLSDMLADFERRLKGGEDVMLFLAGLPHAIDELLKDDEYAFLRTARRVSLGNVHIDEVFALYREVLDVNETTADAVGSGKGGIPEKNSALVETALLRAAGATAGFPYLIQLVGYYLSKETININDKAADKAIFLAKIELYKNIHEPLFWGLSSKDRMFLWAMAQDEGVSEFGDITKRMNVSAGYASKYRERLINAELIYRSGYGALAFTLPFMKEYIEKEYIERLGGEGGKRRL